MRQYQQLLCDVLAMGKDKDDRTGTGTRSLFGYQMRFELSAGFPLVTTKKMFTSGMIDELLWFLSGSTSVEDIPSRSKHWWTPWARDGGSLGPIYGEQYRSSRWFQVVEPSVFEPPKVEFCRGLTFGIGNLGKNKLLPNNRVVVPPHVTMLKNVWRDMLRRCYYKKAKAYQSYGAKGVHVVKEWLLFDNFLNDAMSLPNWCLKVDYPSEYSLDKDIRMAANRYGPDTCMWASRVEQGWNTSTNTPFKATDADGEEHTFPSLGEMVREHGVNVSAVHRCLKGDLHTHHGWSNFEYLGSDKVFRFRELDQLRHAVSNIKHNPDSRRHLINLWHTPAMQHATLPCCHGSVIQMYVADGELSLMVYQRSVDAFIGLPVNIASYALLTMMLAKVCNLKPGALIWTGGDVHIYHNHLEQVQLQLTRTPYDLPKMMIKDRGQSIDDFVFEDFVLEGYECHPHIAGKVAV